MKRKITFLFLLAFAMLGYQTTLAQTRGVTITGNCYLEGQTNHSGVKVLFTAVSPSAVTTEVFTTNDGAFVAGLSEGIYTVEYSKDGYLPYSFPGNVSFFVNTTMDDVTLLLGGFLEVSGPQSGIWPSGYLIKVLDNISVGVGETLIIEPGVIVKFMGHFSLKVYGTLLATGNEGDSIVFTSGQSVPAPNDWQYVIFSGTSSSGNIMAYAVVQYGFNGIYCDNNIGCIITHCRISDSYTNGIVCSGNSSLTITESKITYNNFYSIDDRDGGIRCFSSSTPTIQNNIISHNHGNGVSEGGNSTIQNNSICFNMYDGINCYGASATIQNNIINNNSRNGIYCKQGSPAILNNQISDNNNFGIYCFDCSSIIENNNITNNNSVGIYCERYSFPIIQSNSISNNYSHGIVCQKNGLYPSSPTIGANTICYNSGSGVFTTLGCVPSISNNLFNGNMNGINLATLPSTLDHNLFYENNSLYSGIIPESFGQIVTQNANADSCDTYFNLFMDPKFVEFPEQGNYSWEVEGDSVTFKLGYQMRWRVPYQINIYDSNLNGSGWIEMDWNGEYYYKKFPLNFPQNLGIARVDFSYNSNGLISFWPHLIYNPTGPLFVPGSFDVDYHLTSTSPCIDAGNPAPAYFDPDGTVADMGAFYYDQGSAAPVISDFTATPVTGRMPLVVQFGQNIAGPVTEYLWVFGDGATSTLPNPVHVYNTMGFYSVSLMATGPGGSDMLVKTDYIHVLAPVPPINPAFTASPLLGYAPLEVQFTNQSTGPYQSMLWDFGDGNTSTAISPLHVYQQHGDYSVSLTLFLSGTEKTELKENYIHAIAPQEVVAMFDISGNNGAAPYTVAFFDQPFGSVDSLSWDFGDGATSTLANPTYMYLLPGEYTATLTAFGPLNTSTAGKTILVGSVAPIITQITDRPNDQGGYVYIEFKKSFYDNVIPGKSTESYTIQRQDDGHWVSLNSALAYGQAVYTIEAATLADSTAGNDGISAYRVIAGMDEGTWISEAAEGYSTDNLAPEQPVVLNYALGDEQLAFSWNQSQANDFDYFAIYKSSESGNFAGAAYATQKTTTFTETIAPDEAWFYSITAFDRAGNQSTASEEVSTLHSMNIPIPQGWSGISGYLNVYDPAVENVFEPLTDELIILQNETEVFWPGQNINTIGSWQSSEGYQIKLNQPSDFTLRGTRLADRSLQLNSGWSLMPVLSEQNAGVAGLFASTGLIMVKEVAGWRIYWPEYSISSLEVLEPGKAYFVFMASPATITFPNEATRENLTNRTEFQNLTPWNNPSKTPSTHVIAFDDAATAAFEQGDIVGVFTKNGLCAGISQVDKNATSIMAFGDDELTTTQDGFTTGELMNFGLFRPSTGESFDLEVTLKPEMNDGKFVQHGISVITGLKLSPTAISEKANSHISIFPNPTKGIFTIEGITGEASVKIFNAFGVEITTSKIDLQGTIDLSGQPKGVYFIRIESGEKVSFEKVVLN